MITRVVLIACVALGVSAAARGASDADDEAAKLKRLVEGIARGDDHERELADELIEHIVAPLAEAVGPLDERPLAEQRRVHAALSRVTARLRICLYRLNLPEEDRKLFDDFGRQHPALIEQLYADQPEHRVAALKRVALEPNTAAGVLIVAKIDDWDSEVTDEAFSVAERLHDRVVARNLLRLMRGWMAALKGDELGTEERVVYGAVLPYMMARGTRIVADSEDGTHAPAVLEIVKFLTEPERRSHLVEYGVLAHALGKLGDERARPLLVEMLPDRGVHRAFPQAQGKLAVQTVGDAALVALLRIYKLNPAEFGLLVGSKQWSQCGFETPAARERGHRALLEWLKENADKPAAERGAPTPVQTTEP